jgi:hypothetical protein
MRTISHLSVGRLQATIQAFGPDDARENQLTDWSLKGLQSISDIPSNRLLGLVLSRKLKNFCIAEALAPHVALASARIVEISQLDRKIKFQDQGPTIYRNKELPADGVVLRPKQAFIMSSAGCPLIVASAGDHMIVAHAARDSLIHRGAVTGDPTRKHLSVVDSIIDTFHRYEMPIDTISMTMLFAIPAEEFEHSESHPEYGNYNRALGTFVESRWPGGIVRKDGLMFLDLEQVFIEQAMSSGVKKAFSMCSLGQFPDLVHTARSGERNLIIVKRND